MKYSAFVSLAPSLVMAWGFDSTPPYPEYDTMPQPQAYAPPLAPCNIPAGTFRLDAKEIAARKNISINKLILKLHINHGGLVTLTFQLKPDGREELYVVNPYGNTVDLANICSSNHLNFYFNNINLYGKKLSGEIFAEFIRTGRADYLNVRGYVERYDRSWDSGVRVNLNNHRMDFAYPYTE